jgi:hypothetical protein
MKLRRTPLFVAAVAMYAVLVSVAPVLHHDFACHLKSPTHCTACVGSPAGSPYGSPAPATAPALPAAGAVVVIASEPAAVSSPLQVPGRSPPA